MLIRKSNAIIICSIIVISMTLGGCGRTLMSASDFRPHNPSYPSQEVKDMVGLFIEEANEQQFKLNMANLNIIFVADIPCNECIKGTSILGNCKVNHKIINLNARMWQKRSELANRLTLFHELGHCLLNRGHYIGSDKSIMTAYIPATETFKIYYEDYMDELFNPSLGLYEDIFDEEF